MAISYMEDRSPIVFGQKMYVMRPLYAPNIQGCTIGAGMHFWCTNKDKTSGFG